MAAKLKGTLKHCSIAQQQTCLKLGRTSCRALSAATVGGKRASVVEHSSTQSAIPPIPAIASKTPFTSEVPAWRSERPAFSVAKAAKTLPPNHFARIRELQTFVLPEKVTGSEADRKARGLQAISWALTDIGMLGKELVAAWRRDGMSFRTLVATIFEHEC